MIFVRTTLIVLTEKQLELSQTILSLIGPVREEPGCISYCALCNMNDKNRFTLLEEWESQEDLDNHMQSDRFGVLLGTKTLLSEPLQVRIYTVSQTQGMEAVHAARKNRN